ncbi:uncharacterized protein [Clytia hemisphaerica]|uniref:uncharacterized protein n=1 Tax=Clytia hemisphaerica TaxID=252671 RepID=UPI0034D4473C
MSSASATGNGNILITPPGKDFEHTSMQQQNWYFPSFHPTRFPSPFTPTHYNSHNFTNLFPLQTSNATATDHTEPTELTEPSEVSEPSTEQSTAQDPHTSEAPSYAFLLNFYNQWKDTVPLCQCNRKSYELQDYFDRRRPDYSAAHTLYLNVAKKAIEKFQLTASKNKLQKMNAVYWMIRVLKHDNDATTYQTLNEKLSLLLAGQKSQSKLKREAEEKRGGFHFYEPEPEHPSIEDIAESIISAKYPPKIEKHSYVVVAWERQMGFAYLLEDVQEGENKMVDVEEIRTKDGNLMISWKRKTSSASSKCTLDVVELGEVGSLMGGSGLDKALETVYAPVTVGHMFTGKAYSCSVRGHLLCATALQSFLMDEFWNKLTTSEKEELQGFYDSDDPSQLESKDLSVKLKD